MRIIQYATHIDPCPDWAKDYHNVAWRVTDAETGSLLGMGTDKLNGTVRAKANDHAESVAAWHGRPVKVEIGEIYNQ